MVEFYELDKFTDRARKIMSLSKREAKSLGHNYIGSEHILLSLSQEGISKDIIYNEGLDIKRLRSIIETLSSEKEVLEATLGQIPFTQDAKKLLENTSTISKEWKDDYIGTEHLLYALLEDRESKASIILRELNINIGYIKEAIMDYRREIEPFIPENWVFRGDALTLEEALDVANFKLSTPYLDEHAKKLRDIYREVDNGELQIVGRLMGKDFSKVKILGNEGNYNTLKEFLDNNKIPYEIKD